MIVLVEPLVNEYLETRNWPKSLEQSDLKREQVLILITFHLSNQLKTKSLKGAKKSSGFKLVTVDKVQSAAVYSDIEDMMLNYNLPVHNWNPTVTKIEKIVNPTLKKKFEAAKTRCSGRYTALKFHGTGDEGIKNIPKEGFWDPKQHSKTGMFGKGIYFSTNSSKSGQYVYTKGSNKILVCEVLLGKSKVVQGSDSSLTLEKIRHEGYDSVFAPRDTKSYGGVMHDEFVIFDPDQALPRYIIHYTLDDDQDGYSPFVRVPTLPRRTTSLRTGSLRASAAPLWQQVSCS